MLLFTWIKLLFQPKSVTGAATDAISAPVVGIGVPPAAPASNVTAMPDRPKRSRFTVEDVVQGRRDQAQTEILCVYSKVPPRYAVYRTQNRTVVQYADEKPDTPYEIRIYPGADGRFTLYEDDGATYRYEAGEHATVVLAWDDARHTLRIAAREGRFPGMTALRALRIHLMAKASGRIQEKTVRYAGAPVEVRLDR